MTSHVARTLAELKIAPKVRFAESGGTFVIFNAASGTFVTLTGEAAKTWKVLTTQPDAEIDSGSQAFVEAFLALGLLFTRNEFPECAVPEPLPDGVHRHTELEHLILEDPLIDLSLLGNVHQSHMPNSNRRFILERLQVRRFVSTLLQDAHRYVASHDMALSHAEVGSSLVRVQVPARDSESLIPVSDAFTLPLVTDGKGAEFCISLFDDAGSERRRSTDFGVDWHLPLGLLDPDVSGDFRVAIDRHTQMVSVFSPSSRQCLVWSRDFSALPYWSAATPFRLQLSWIADVLNYEFLHASAVTVAGGAVVFAGPSGAGKSTLALLLARSGCPLIADDFLIASPDSVQGIYRRVKVHDARLSRTLGTGWRILNAGVPGQKRIVELDKDVVPGFTPIRAIVVPRVGNRLAVEPLDPGETLSAIAPPSLSGLLGGNPASLNRIADLVNHFPCYQLTHDARIFEDSDELQRIIERLG